MLKRISLALAVAAWASLVQAQGVSPGSNAIPVPVSVPNGGQGNATLAAHAVLVGQGASAVTTPALGTTGWVLTSNGASTDPSFQVSPGAAGCTPCAVAQTVSVAGAASTPPYLFTGAAFTGGSGTTTQPHLLFQPTGATAATSWSTNGTWLGVNAASGFTGNFFDFRVNGGSSVGSLSFVGILSLASSMNVGGSGALCFTGRGCFTSGGAGLMQIGNIDVAAPVAQTVSVQSVVTGTTNTAGVNTTIRASRGTGTGVGGDYIFQVAPAGTTGTTPNAYVTAFTLSQTGVPKLPGFTVSTLPATPPTGSMAYVTDAVACTFLASLTGGGSAFCPVLYSGSAWVGG